MNCENIYCIYQKNDECTLNEIKVDVSGMCANCILANIPEEFLDKAKAHMKNLDDLQKYADIFNNELYEDLKFEVKMKLVMDEYRKNHPEEFNGVSQNLLNEQY